MKMLRELYSNRLFDDQMSDRYLHEKAETTAYECNGLQGDSIRAKNDSSV
jgi:hypothetical protein